MKFKPLVAMMLLVPVLASASIRDELAAIDAEKVAAAQQTAPGGGSRPGSMVAPPEWRRGNLQPIRWVSGRMTPKRWSPK